MAEPKKSANAAEMPLVAHLIELRNRMMKIVLSVLVIFLICVPFSNDLYTFLAEPLMAHMPEDTSMIATDVASPFFTPFKLTLVFSIFASMPLILYQIWGFVAPGLYRHERRMVIPLLASSTLLFYLGAAFAYFVVFPIVFGFFTSTAPEGVAVMTDISKYLDFVLKMFFAFGLAFEVPIATIVLVWVGVTTPEALGKKRPYIIVAAFVLGMLLTPPDAISQTLLAVPMVLLFELGLFLSKLFVRRREREEAAENSNAGENMDTESSDEEQYVREDDSEIEEDDEFIYENEELSDEDFDKAFDQAERDELGKNGNDPTDK